MHTQGVWLTLDIQGGRHLNSTPCVANKATVHPTVVTLHIIEVEDIMIRLYTQGEGAISSVPPLYIYRRRSLEYTTCKVSTAFDSDSAC